MLHDPFERLCQANTLKEKNELRELIQDQGYPLLSRLITSLKDKIKHYKDDEAHDVISLIERASDTIPNPGAISPSWGKIWNQLLAMSTAKNKVLQSIAMGERDGEWQIVMDNPFLLQDVACYPSLTFFEAAYLYGYFQPELQKGEYIRFQKIKTLVMDRR